MSRVPQNAYSQKAETFLLGRSQSLTRLHTRCGRDTPPQSNPSTPRLQRVHDAFGVSLSVPVITQTSTRSLHTRLHPRKKSKVGDYRVKGQLVMPYTV